MKLKSQVPDSIKLEKYIRAGHSVFLAGPPCCGKTYLATSVLDERGFLYALVDCNYFRNLSKLYIDILTYFNDKQEVKNVRRKISEHHMGSVVFMELIEEYYCSVLETMKGDKLYLILDDVEVLVRCSMMDTLVALSNLKPLSLILIGNETPRQLFSSLDDHSARAQLLDRLQLIYIVPFSKEDVYELVVQDMPKKFPKIYRKYALNTVSLLYFNDTNNLMEIKSFCQETFPTFLGYLEKEVDKHMSRHNSKTRDRDALFEEDLIQSKATMEFYKSFRKISNKVNIHNWHAETSDVRASFGVSILILSALIAAYTRASADRINFVKFQKRGKRPSLRVPDAEPREFTKERLIHIYLGLSNLLRGESNDESIDSAEFSDTVLSDIQILENQNILHATPKNGLDSTTRFKLSTTLPIRFYQRIAAQINLELDEIYGLPMEITSKVD